MTFGAQAELTGVPNRPFPQKLASFRRMPPQVSRWKSGPSASHPKLASFRQMPLQAEQATAAGA